MLLLMLRPFQQLFKIPYKKIKQMFGVIIILQNMKKYLALFNYMIVNRNLHNIQKIKFVKPEEE